MRSRGSSWNCTGSTGRNSNANRRSGRSRTCELAPAVWSQENTDFQKDGPYVALSGVPGFTLDGLTFDGSSYYQKVGGEEILILPRLDSRTALRGIVGFRTTRGAFEVGYEQTKHVGTFLDFSGEATFHSI